MAIDASTSPNQKNKNVAPSQAKIALVIGIAVVALISGFIAFSRYDWMLGTNPPNEDKQKEFLDLAKQMPEVNSFLKKYPNADVKIDLIGSASNPTQPYLPSYNAIITYSFQKWNNKGKEWETSLAIHIDKENPTGYNINGNTYSSKAFHGYYYTSVPQCIAYGAGTTNGSIPGFPEGTNMAYLSKDCSEVEILPH